MTLRGLLVGLAVSTILAAAVPRGALPANRAAAGSPNPLAGTWSLVLVDNVLPDSNRVHLYGSHPSGLLMFDGAGHYSLQIVSADRPPFAANDKGRGTPAEYEAAFRGAVGEVEWERVK